MKALVYLVCSAGACALALGQQIKFPSTTASIKGVWRLVHVEQRDPTGKATTLPVHGGLFIFAERHYSVVWSEGSGPVTSFATPWTPTDAERLKRYSALTANAGSYELSGTIMTIRPVAAKVPDVMGGWANFEVRQSGDTLSLTYVRVRSRDGVPMQEYESGGRFEYRLVRVE